MSTSASVPQPSGSRQVYYRSSFWAGWNIPSLIIIVVGFPILAIVLQSLLMLIMGAGIIVFLLIVGYVLVKRQRIVTSPEGIWSYSPMTNQHARWDNIVGLGHATINFQDMRGLVTREPAMQFKSGWRNLLIASAVVTTAGGRAGSGITAANAISDMDTLTHFIPIEFFVTDWEHGALIEDIRRYAPQVFTPSMTSAPQA